MPISRNNISSRVYGWLLLAYPPEFRREFGDEMLQVFCDCYRAEARTGSLPRFWFRTLLDLVATAAKERADSSGKEGVFMNRRSDAIALLACAGIIVIAFLLLTYGRKNEIGSILVFGYALDALVTTGIIGNLIVFVLNKTTKLDPLRTALWTFAVVHAVALLFVLLVVRRIDPGFSSARVVTGYLVSFVIWAALHFAWRHRPPVYS
ncbi:MAG TPA: hypothetical protein VFI57_04090 [Pyrinomonadaceae bacterium]|nr:hypothetical protein [Pyrinomonadaceae bacterium]